MKIEAQVPAANVRVVDEGTGYCTLIVRGIPTDAALDGVQVVRRRGGISDGERTAFNAKSKALDRSRGEAKGSARREALEAAAVEFRRDITAVDDLTRSEANWALDWLESQLRAGHLPEPATPGTPGTATLQDGAP